MTYILFYTAPETGDDGRPNGQWSVRSTHYAKIEDPLPIPGTDTFVSGNLMETEAVTVCNNRQRLSYAKAYREKQEKRDAQEA